METFIFISYLQFTCLSLNDVVWVFRQSITHQLVIKSQFWNRSLYPVYPLIIKYECQSPSFPNKIYFPSSLPLSFSFKLLFFLFHFLFIFLFYSFFFLLFIHFSQSLMSSCLENRKKKNSKICWNASWTVKKVVDTFIYTSRTNWYSAMLVHKGYMKMSQLLAKNFFFPVLVPVKT